MPDDDQHPRPGGPPAGAGRSDGAGDGPPGAGAPLDETREHRPFADNGADADADPAAGGDATTVEPADGKPDATAVQPAVTDPDATTVQPAVGPATGAERTEPPPRPQTWSARAGVPVADSAPTAVQWDEEPPQDQGGRWWLPILIGIIALLLLGVLGYGLWLIASSNDDPATSPTDIPTGSVVTRAPTSAPPAATEAPTTQPAEPVQVPALAGGSVAQATDQLDDLGLRYRVRYEVTEDADEGVVLETDPPQGSRVAPGTRITLIVATPPETQEPAPESPSPGGDADEDSQG